MRTEDMTPEDFLDPTYRAVALALSREYRKAKAARLRRTIRRERVNDETTNKTNAASKG